MEHSPSATPSGAIPPRCPLCSLLPAGCFIFLAVLALLAYSDVQMRRTAAFTQGEQGRLRAERILKDLRDDYAELAAAEATLLRGANHEQAKKIRRQEKNFQPGGMVTYYDQYGEAVLLDSALPGEGATAPKPRGIRKILEKTLTGQPMADYGELADMPAISAGAPVQDSFIRTVLVSVPLDDGILREIGSATDTDMALVALDSSLGRSISGSLADDTFPDIWEKWAERLERSEAPETLAVPFEDVSRIVSGVSLRDSSGKVIGALFVSPVAQENGDLLTQRLLPYVGLALLAALLGMGLLLLWLRYRERVTFSRLAESMEGLVSGTRPPAVESLPAPLQRPFRNIAAVLARNREFLQHASRENREDRPDAAYESGISEKDAAAYQQFFFAAPHGIFQCAADGTFIQANQRFASMLEYDSTAQLFAACSSIMDLCIRQDESLAVLTMLKEQPNLRHGVKLRLRSGIPGAFWLVTTSFSSGEQSIEGFLLDRSSEDRLERALQELTTWRVRASSLSLLLAATCLQSQAYFAPGVQSPGRDTASALPAADRSAAVSRTEPADSAAADSSGERRRGINSLKAIFEDIYQIAVTEAEGSPLVAAPIDLTRLMERVYRQALPAMQVKGISLACDIAPDLTFRVSGSAPLLRHALFRALLTVAVPSQGGSAYLSVRRDPNAPRIPGISRLRFSASWTAGAVNTQPENPEHHRIASFTPETGQDAGQNQPPALTFMNTEDERHVIRFLVQKMQGELLENVSTAALRSVEFIVQLEHLSSGMEDMAGQERASARGQEFSFGSASPLGDTHRDAREDAYSLPAYISVEPGPGGIPETMDGAMAEPAQGEEGDGVSDAAPLSILVDDDPVSAEEHSVLRETPGLNLLLVDDSQNTRLLFSLYLRDTNHRITEARNGQEGVEAFRQRRFDVIFMDMEMPFMNGYQATRIIRALEADAGTSPTPIVAQTAHVLPEFKHQCMLAGCTEFLSKPFSKNALLTMLDAFVQLKQDAQNHQKNQG